jgi:diacylglycerol kinase family enzyme
MSPQKLLFVINPISGGLDKLDSETQIKDFCLIKNIEPIIYRTTGEEDALHILELSAQTDPQAIVAVGGDGTVNLVGTMLIVKIYRWELFLWALEMAFQRISIFLKILIRRCR